MQRHWWGGDAILRPGLATGALTDDLTLALDARESSTLFSDAFGVTPAVDGGTVGYWANQVDAASSINQGTAGRRPTWSSNTIVYNGGGTGTKAFVTNNLSSVFLSDNENTLFILASITSGSPTTAYLFNDGGSNYLRWSGTQLVANMAATTGSSVSINASVSTMYLIQVRRGGGYLNISLNGGAETRVATTGTLTLSGTMSIPGSNAETKCAHTVVAYYWWNKNLSLAYRNQFGNSVQTAGLITWTNQT